MISIREIIQNSLRKGDKTMKKRILTMIAAAAMTMAMSVTSFAAIGQWRQDSVGWWWERNGGSYLTNQWMWIDGNADGIAECYCFGPDGYMLANTTTPDGYTVDANGAWTVNGVVQSRGVLPEIDDAAVAVQDSSGAVFFLCRSMGNAWKLTVLSVPQPLTQAPERLDDPPLPAGTPLFPSASQTKYSQRLK